MEVLGAWQNAIVTSWNQVWFSVLGVVPNILGAIVVFSVGLLSAYWVKRLMMELFRIVRFEKLAKSAGIDDYLARADIKFNFQELLATVVEWIVILIFFLAVVDILGLGAVSQVLTRVLSYIPNVLAASLIFAAGYMIAGLADGLVRGSLTTIDHKIAKPIGKLARWVILVVAFFAAIDQLQIAKGLILTFFQGLTYTVVLVVGLAVGLGSKDLVSKILNDWYDKITK